MRLQRVKPLSAILSDADERSELKRTLGPWSLTAMGIGAIIGTGIFVLTGVASATRAGPALAVSFVIAGAVSSLAALCYAEVASKVPISGSAYTYAYASLGELFAWIIGWDLILEYALGAATVSVGWAGYFGTVLSALHVSVPVQWSHNHWDPTPGIANIPAAAVILLMTVLLAKGTRESGAANNVIVGIKLLIVFFFIAVGAGHVHLANYHIAAGPASGAGGFMPFGWAGVLGGAAFCFFAYIGFDAVSTAAEECKNPSKDLPLGIIMSLLICTILYIIVVTVLNGMVPFTSLNVPNPVAFAMQASGLGWAAVLVSIGALAGLTTVLLVMMFGQSRVIYAMARDGLMPKAFARVHRTWRTPIFSTIFFGLFIAALAAFTPIGTLTSLTNMGTFAAFILVSAAVPILRRSHPERSGSFNVPFGPYVVPALSAATALGLMYYLRVGNALVWGVPLPWLGFVLWLIVGLLLYAFYGRKHSTVALQEVERLAVRQPPVN